LLLTRDNLLGRLQYQLQRASSIDLAVAWASDCDALSHLLSFGESGKPLRTVVGIWGNGTHPNALHRLHKFGHLRIVTEPSRLFHPKVYLFRRSGTNSIAWIGSANLTRSAFQQNDELVHEFEDKDGAVTSWFDTLWNSLPEEVDSIIENYETNWVPPNFGRAAATPQPKPIHDIYAVGDQLTDWQSFVRGVEAADRFWSTTWDRPATVLGDVNSWLNTITLGHAEVIQPDWDHLSTEGRRLILGREATNNGYGNGYGFLGSMGGAGVANNVFRENTPENLAIRNRIRAALQPILNASDADFVEAACNFIAAVDEVNGFGGAIATRILALARPDRAISVNNGSRVHLAKLTGLPPNSLSNPPRGRANSYGDLLHWFEGQGWYSNPNPRNAYERLLADARAALFDAFVYAPR